MKSYSSNMSNIIWLAFPFLSDDNSFLEKCQNKTGKRFGEFAATLDWYRRRRPTDLFVLFLGVVLAGRLNLSDVCLDVYCYAGLREILRLAVANLEDTTVKPKNDLSQDS